MTKDEFRQLQDEAGVERDHCPVCDSTALEDMACVDCGTDFNSTKL